PTGWWLNAFLALYQNKKKIPIDYLKIDIYSVGIIFGQLFLIYGFEYLLPSMRRPIKNFIHRGLLHPDPNNRYDPLTAILYWNQIFEPHKKG
ncbi:MAG: hypothetical protein EBZ69_06260, partial [Alphaproteobacteria bacterium]|nr:hypothetical protein [Alphaproteobacteria bacterium]